MPAYATVAAMKAAAGRSVGDVVYTRGCLADRDGGGALWQALPENTETAIPYFIENASGSPVQWHLIPTGGEITALQAGIRPAPTYGQVVGTTNRDRAVSAFHYCTQHLPGGGFAIEGGDFDFYPTDFPHSEVPPRFYNRGGPNVNRIRPDQNFNWNGEHIWQMGDPTGDKQGFYMVDDLNFAAKKGEDTYCVGLIAHRTNRGHVRANAKWLTGGGFRFYGTYNGIIDVVTFECGSQFGGEDHFATLIGPHPTAIKADGAQGNDIKIYITSEQDVCGILLQGSVLLRSSAPWKIHGSGDAHRAQVPLRIMGCPDFRIAIQTTRGFNGKSHVEILDNKNSAGIGWNGGWASQRELETRGILDHVVMKNDVPRNRTVVGDYYTVTYDCGNADSHVVFTGHVHNPAENVERPDGSTLAGAVQKYINVIAPSLQSGPGGTLDADTIVFDHNYPLDQMINNPANRPISGRRLAQAT